MESNTYVPKEMGEQIIQTIWGKKIQIKDGKNKVRGRVKSCSYDDGRIRLKLDGYFKTFILDMNSYIKML